MTDRLWYDQQDLTQWQAVVTAASDGRVSLDKTAFFPGGGGQPPDEGTLTWDGLTAAVAPDGLDLVVDEGVPAPAPGTVVTCQVDAKRRALVMRTHTAMHILTAIMGREYGAHVTGGDMRPGTGRMDFDLAEVSPTFREDVLVWFDAEVAADHPVTVEYLDPSDFDAATMVHTAENLVPEGLDRIRLVRIGDLDVQADGGTHVASTGQVGRIELAKVENKGRGHRRVRLTLVE